MKFDNKLIGTGQPMETENIILGKAKYEDWKPMYRNVFSRPESAEFMLWKVTTDEDSAKERMRRTIAWQKEHDAWLVYVKEIQAGVYEDTGIAIGPEYTGRGYGRQVLGLLLQYCTSLGGTEFYYSTRSGNSASKALALSCGFVFLRAEQKTDIRNGKSYILEVYKRNLDV